MNNQRYEELMLKNTEDAIAYKEMIWKKTGITLDDNDPSIVMFIVFHRWLEDFYSQQSELDDKNAQEIATALHPILEQMQKTVALIEQKNEYLQNNIENLKSFYNEMIKFFSATAEEKAKKIVDNQISGSLNTLQNEVSGNLKKNNGLMIAVLIVQAIMVFVFLVKVL